MLGSKCNLARLETLDPEIVYDFLETGESSAIPKALQNYIYQIQWAAEIWNGERNLRRAAQKLRTRIKSMQKVPISLQMCLSRIHDSLNYFSVDNNVAQEIWDRDTADKLEDLAYIALESKQLSVAKQCLVKANELRAKANSAMDPDKLKPPVFLLTERLSAEDLGFKDEKLLSITRKANEGVYAKMIGDLPVEESEKKRLLSDAGIQDVDFEEVEDDEV